MNIQYSSIFIDFNERVRRGNPKTRVITKRLTEGRTDGIYEGAHGGDLRRGVRRGFTKGLTEGIYEGAHGGDLRRGARRGFTKGRTQGIYEGVYHRVRGVPLRLRLGGVITKGYTTKLGGVPY